MASTPEEVGMFSLSNLPENMQSKIRVNHETGCWEWIGTLCKGYGRWRRPAEKRGIRGECVYTHRHAYELANGKIGEGLQIDHLCRNPLCCNPSHLEAVSPRVNNLRGQGVAARNASKTHCPAGHEYTPENTRIDEGSRRCITCGRERSKRFHDRRKANKRKGLVS